MRLSLLHCIFTLRFFAPSLRYSAVKKVKRGEALSFYAESRKAIACLSFFYSIRDTQNIKIQLPNSPCIVYKAC